MLLRALAYWELGLLDLAHADLEELSASVAGGPTAQYALLLRHVMLRLDDRDDDARELLSASSLASDPGWTGRVARMLLGHSSPAMLLEAAATADERAEALFYIGAAAMGDGDTDIGRERLEECVALRRERIIETGFATMLLRSIDADPAG